MTQGGLPFEDYERDVGRIDLGAQAMVLTGFAREAAPDLLSAVVDVGRAAPFRRQVTPNGHMTSVEGTSCGALGWVSDLQGYRYQATDPATGSAWPVMPRSFRDIAQAAAAAGGFAGFDPDACSIIRYIPGARLSLHQDLSERDITHPVVTVSLGLPAMFLWGGAARSDPSRAIPLFHGDVAIWGGVDRLRFHGVKPLAEGVHPTAGGVRYSLTFRIAG